MTLLCSSSDPFVTDMSASATGSASEELEQEEKRLIRKIDWILMPILTVTLGLQVWLGHAGIADKSVL